MNGIAAIAQAWNIGEVCRVEQVALGVLSTNWLVDTAESRYFLKRYRFEDRARIEEIHAAKRYFSDAGIPVILPLALPDSSTILSMNAEHYALFPFIAERQLSRGALSDIAIASMGRMLARIHLAGKESTLRIEKDTFRGWNANETKLDGYIERLESLARPTPFDTLALEDLQVKRALIAENPTSFESIDVRLDHLLHGDYLDHNLFFDAKDEVSRVFDLEKSQYGPRAFELVRALLYSVLHEEYGEAGMRRGRVFIDAYRALYPMSDAELRAGIELFFLKALRNVWIQKECYDLGNRRPEQFLKPDLIRIQYLAKHRDTLAKALAA